MNSNIPSITGCALVVMSLGIYLVVKGFKPSPIISDVGGRVVVDVGSTAPAV
jgi:hypothetical protein